jgi:protein JBTS26
VQIKKRDGVKGRVVEIIITESWGDLFYVGLNGIQIFDSNSNQLQIELKNIDAKPRDMNSIPGH